MPGLLAVLFASSLALPAASLESASPSANDDALLARWFLAGYEDARLIENRCHFLSDEARSAFAASLDYIKAQAAKELGAAGEQVVKQALEQGKRQSKWWRYEDCGNTSKDRVEDRLYRLDDLVAGRKQLEQSAEAREFGPSLTTAMLEVEESHVVLEPDRSVAEGEERRAALVFYTLLRRGIEVEQACRFVAVADRARFDRTLARSMALTVPRVKDSRAIALADATESAVHRDCGEDERTMVDRVVGTLPTLEAANELNDQLRELIRAKLQGKP